MVTTRGNHNKVYTKSCTARVILLSYSAVQQKIIKMIFVFNVIFLTIGAQKCYILYTKMITSFYWTV